MYENARHSRVLGVKNMVEMVRCGGGKKEITQGHHKVVQGPSRSIKQRPPELPLATHSQKQSRLGHGLYSSVLTNGNKDRVKYLT